MTFDEIFSDGSFTEERIEAAGVEVMKLVERDKEAARAAKRTLGDMLLFAIADERCSRPLKRAQRVSIQ